MKQIFDKDGNEIPKHEISILIIEAVAEVKRDEDKRLAEQIAKFANKRSSEGKEFTVEDSETVISVIKNYQKTHSFSNF